MDDYIYQDVSMVQRVILEMSIDSVIKDGVTGVDLVHSVKKIKAYNYRNQIVDISKFKINDLTYIKDDGIYRVSHVDINFSEKIINIF